MRIRVRGAARLRRVSWFAHRDCHDPVRAFPGAHRHHAAALHRFRGPTPRGRPPRVRVRCRRIHSNRRLHGHRHLGANRASYLGGSIAPLRSAASRLLREKSDTPNAPTQVDLSRDRRGLKIAKDRPAGWTTSTVRIPFRRLSPKRRNRRFLPAAPGRHCRTGDPHRHNLRLVVYIAKKFDNTSVGVEDLISIGTIGLIKGISSFDASKGARLAPMQPGALKMKFSCT